MLCVGWYGCVFLYCICVVIVEFAGILATPDVIWTNIPFPKPQIHQTAVINEMYENTPHIPLKLPTAHAVRNLFSVFFCTDLNMDVISWMCLFPVFIVYEMFWFFNWWVRGVLYNSISHIPLTECFHLLQKKNNNKKWECMTHWCTDFAVHSMSATTRALSQVCKDYTNSEESTHTHKCTIHPPLSRTLFDLFLWHLTGKGFKTKMPITKQVHVGTEGCCLIKQASCLT